MHLGSIYFYVKDFRRSIEFYEQLLNMKVTSQNKDRFAMFEFEGHCIALMNGYFDRDYPGKVIHKGQRSQYFDDAAEIAAEPDSRKAVLNFWVEDLRKEYRRIEQINPPMLTEIRYLCYVSPYYYFNLTDPDGNIIEVTGAYVPGENEFGE